MIRLGWFSSGRDEAARNLLATIIKKRDEGVLDVSVSFVFCNWEEGEEPGHSDFAERKKFFDLVRILDIPLITLSWKRFRATLKEGGKDEWRAAYGRKMRTMLYGNPFDIGIMAGYMLWIDSDTSVRFDLLNLHPALPGGPKGTWQEVIYKIIATRPERHGSMVHLCQPDSDKGPAVAFCSFSLLAPEYVRLWTDMDQRHGSSSFDLLSKEEMENEELFLRLRKDGERRELPLLTYAIKMFADGLVTVRNGKLYEDGKPLAGAYNLTEAVDRAIASGEF
jgi:phosphoribosylglycinamide formyltransferase-1